MNSLSELLPMFVSSRPASGWVPRRSRRPSPGSSFKVVHEMRLVPINRPTLITLAVAAARPMVPVVFATPTSELIRIVLKMLG
jgi:hypothetical protein